jgi:peptidoglycan/LPS O-acetylase OafA/YrhL
MSASVTTFAETTRSREGTGPVSITGQGAQRQFYRPELDALRFFAYACVFVHHGMFAAAPTFSNANGFGLSLFFLLSAFLITELLQREKDLSGSIRMRDFYIRRCLRIWPLYYGFMAFSAVLGFVYPSHAAPIWYLCSYLLMVGNCYIAQHGFPDSPSNFLWSISVEEQFYLFWPMLNRYSSRRGLTVVAGCIVPGAAAVTFFLARDGASKLAIWSNTFVQFQMFGLGTLLSLHLSGKLPRWPLSVRAMLFLSGFGLWLAAARWTAVFPGAAHASSGAVAILMGYISAGVGCVLIFLAVYGLPAKRVPKRLIYFGKISYGLYVFHEVSLDAAAWLLNKFPQTATASHHTRFGIAHLALGFVISTLAAACSYQFFERPFLRLKDHFAVVHSRSA